jgi:adenylate cyclase
MSETRKLAAILVADVVGYSRLAGVDEDRTLARLRGLRSDLIDPAIAAHHGRIVKRTGDGSIIEFRSVVDAVRCAIEVQIGLIERNAGVPPERRIEFRVGVHLGDVVEESDGDLMGDGVNIAARLEGVAKPGTICLSEDAYRQVSGRLEMAVTDLGPTQLKNIDKSIRAYLVEVGKPGQAKQIANASGGRRSLLVPLAGAIVALFVVAGGAWYLAGANRIAIPGWKAPAPSEAAHLSIVVLPFANLSNDPGQDYFVDGVTDNLTTELSRIRNSFVIARNTAFTYKGKSVDAKEIAKELGVRYVLEGSVQRDQNRVRVNAQLIDADTGAHLWADRFEDEIGDLFKLQDELVARLANALGVALIRAEGARAARVVNPDAVDLTMRGWASLKESRVLKAKDVEARALFQQAIRIDPNDADALAGDAFASVLEYANWRNPNTDYNAEILDQADKAISLAPDALWAYYAKSEYLYFLHRLDEALAAADAGLAVNPNFAPLYGMRSLAANGQKRWEAAQADVQQAFRLSPRDPEAGVWHFLSCGTQIGFGRFDLASDECQKSTQGGFRTQYSWALQAAAFALDGKAEEAKSAVTEALRLNPKLTVKFLSGLTYDPVVADGYRKAGIPEE